MVYLGRSHSGSVKAASSTRKALGGLTPSTVGTISALPPWASVARSNLYVRFADPVNNLVMLLLGLPFILSRERNIKASALMCVLMVGAFFAFTYICRYMQIGPYGAAFLPIVLFGPVAVVMLDAVKT